MTHANARTPASPWWWSRPACASSAPCACPAPCRQWGGRAPVAISSPAGCATAAGSTVEDAQRQVAVACQRERRGIHHLQVARNHFVVGERIEAHRIAVLLRILVVDAVHLRGLEQQVGADLDRAQRRARIGGEERRTHAGGENADAALLEVADRAAADVVLAHLVDLDRAHHARVGADHSPARPASQRVDHGGEHAHLVAGDAVMPRRPGPRR